MSENTSISLHDPADTIWEVERFDLDPFPFPISMDARHKDG
jgi:hypothetical protein